MRMRRSVNRKELLALPVRVRDMEDQRRVSELLALADEQWAIIKEETARLDELETAALLQVMGGVAP